MTIPTLTLAESLTQFDGRRVAVWKTKPGKWGVKDHETCETLFFTHDLMLVEVVAEIDNDARDRCLDSGGRTDRVHAVIVGTIGEIGGGDMYAITYDCDEGHFRYRAGGAYTSSNYAHARTLFLVGNNLTSDNHGV